MKKKAGILMAISSLPSAYGIGDFGPRAYQFIDEIRENHVKIWQILPFNRLGYGNSPYQPHSSIAGDELFISLELLVKAGLLHAEELKPFSSATTGIDYDAVRLYKEVYLQKAFQQFKASPSMQEQFQIFVQEQAWLHNYTVFMTFKKINHMALWLEWPAEHKNWIKDKQFDLAVHHEEILYQKFLQFIFFSQWHQLKVYAKQKGIEIMGDIPFYVGIDSIDVWENQEEFLLDDQGWPTFVAGVPPDYFSATGQRWGNPLYNWQKMHANHYRFWVNRLAANMQAFDILRIDHFRAFDTYWQIPASCPTAIEGQWIEGPAYDFFNAIYKQLPHLNLVAEDLGEMRPEVHHLRDHYRFAGMKIIQFTFDPNEHNNNFEDRENMIVYTGTHDNQTIRSWYQDQTLEVQQQTDAYLQQKGFTGDFTERWLRFALSNIAKWVIIPTQDLLNLDDTARMNTPGTIGSPNWQWQMHDSAAWQEALQRYGKLIVAYHRN